VPPLLRSAPLALGLLLLTASATAQTTDTTATADSLEAIPSERPGDAETRAFYAVYDVDHPAFEAWMRSTNNAATPLFVAAVPLHGLGALAAGGSGGPVGRMALSELGTLGVIAAGKFLFQRPRPFVALPDVTPRQLHPPSNLDPYSFPSGHAALSFAIATSASLSYPEWYVIVPAYAWASSTALARVWFGMHYPTDAAVGAALGAGVAVLAHVLLHEGEDAVEDVVEDVVEANAMATGVPLVAFRLPLSP